MAAERRLSVRREKSGLAATKAMILKIIVHPLFLDLLQQPALPFRAQ
jgi:hypothetical protein